jgi:error-prone DNA polymerase
MGWENPSRTWRDFERLLSWKQHGEAEPRLEAARVQEWWERRGAAAPVIDRSPPGPRIPYAELHCHSHFSFLDGVSDPAELVGEALRLGLRGLAITDHDGFYGVARFARAARDSGLVTVFGAELSVGLTEPRDGEPDPTGHHLLALARGTAGYRVLSTAIGQAQLAGGEKGRPAYDLPRLAEGLRDQVVVLTGCRKGAVRAALARHGHGEAGLRAAVRELRALAEMFGEESVFVELIDHDQPTDDTVNDLLATAAERADLATVASNNVHYARPADHAVSLALAALRARRDLDGMESWLPAAPTAHLRSGEEMARRFARFPGAVERSVEIADQCGCDFATVRPRLPDFPVPEGFPSEAAYLRELVARGARERYGAPSAKPDVYRQLNHELRVIQELRYPGYFLIVWDIVQFCRREGILCQGRGSAANSAVCYALGITSVDAIKHGLLFERFLSPEREGPPDIDLDIESSRRELVIQYVYRRYGRDRAAQVANVITYRAKLALRDAARVLGYATGTRDAWARRIGPHESLPVLASHTGAAAPPGANAPSGTSAVVSSDASSSPDISGGGDAVDDASGDLAESDTGAPSPLAPETTADVESQVPERVLWLADRLLRLPRHLGIHSGGMVLCDRPVFEVVPVEWARMADRSVLQWDKDDCADASLVKFDLLGLGMLGALHDAFDLVRDHHDVSLSLHQLPQEDPAVYEMLCDADSVGVFQVESRAQMATLPRLKPRCLYDLVIEVALIRPGPIQGGAVHPYLRRRSGVETPTAPHPLLEPVLARTLGVPLFQEQVMQMAIAAAGFSAAESDLLRRAMGAKRSDERMLELRGRLMAGMADKGIPDDIAEDIFEKLRAFSNFGFPESHSISFAYLVYASSYLKRYYPAAFTTALLKNQPMGFYAPATLVADARRHGVVVRGVDVISSDVDASLEPLTEAERSAYTPKHRHASPHPQPAIRLGLAGVRDLGRDAAERVVVERHDGGDFVDLPDFVRRTGLSLAALEALALGGAFASFGIGRREALWSVGALVGTGPEQLPASVPGSVPPPLPAMTAVEQTLADLWATSVSPDSHPIQHVRAELTRQGVTPTGRVASLRDRQLVRVAGLVTHRQRPPTAGGTCFINLEDETGMTNVICPPTLWESQRRTGLDHAALIVHGVVERSGSAVNVIAGRLEPLRVATHSRSRDFR